MTQKMPQVLQEEGCWKKKHSYGWRWDVSFFSDVKRCFAETIRATSVKGMFREVEKKFLFYNMMLKLWC